MRRISRNGPCQDQAKQKLQKSCCRNTTTSPPHANPAETIPNLNNQVGESVQAKQPTDPNLKLKTNSIHSTESGLTTRSSTTPTIPNSVEKTKTNTPAPSPAPSHHPQILQSLRQGHQLQQQLRHQRKVKMPSTKIFPPKQLPTKGLSEEKLKTWTTEIEVWLGADDDMARFMQDGQYSNRRQKGSPQAESKPCKTTTPPWPTQKERPSREQPTEMRSWQGGKGSSKHSSAKWPSASPSTTTTSP